MNLRRLILVSTILGAVFFTTGLGWSQGTERAEFKIKGIRQQQVDAPSYGGGSDMGSRPSTLWRKWLKIEVHFSSEPEWSDDVLIKYYVLIGTGRDAKLFTGEVTHINVAKGSQHYSAMFIHPNTLKRYGAGQIEAVAVELFHQNRRIGSDSEPASQQRWWEKYTPIPGFLLAPQDTPWGPVAHERYEAIKFQK